MKKFYCIEPDLCMSQPELIIQSSKDIVLPKYLYTQLIYLKNGNFANATTTATQILDVLEAETHSNDLIFRNLNNGIIYFINEKIYGDQLNILNIPLDNNNLLDCYLLSSLHLAEILESQIVFLASSPELRRKCHSLNMEIMVVEEFLVGGETWFKPELFLPLQESTIQQEVTVPEITQQESNNLESTINNIPEIPFLVTEPESPQDNSLPSIEWRDIPMPPKPNNIQWIDVV